MSDVAPTVRETAHFRLHVTPGSFAEKSLGQIAARTETAYTAVGELLGLDGSGEERIDVDLSEDLLPAGGGARTDTTELGRAEIREAYRSDSPAPGLERAVLLARLARATGASRPVAPFLLDGLMAGVTKSPGMESPTTPKGPRPGPGAPSPNGAGTAGPPPGSRPPSGPGAAGPGGPPPGARPPSGAGPGGFGGPPPGAGPPPPRPPGGPPSGPQGSPLAQAKTQGTLPPLRALLAGPTPATRGLYYLAAASFVEFLLKQYQPRQFLTLLGQFDADRPDEAARAAYRRAFGDLEKAWKATLRLPPVGGVLPLLGGLMPFFRPHTVSVVEILIELGIAVGYTTFVAVVQKPLFDQGIGAGNLGVVIQIIAELVVLFVISSLISLRQNYATAQLAQKVLSTIRLRIFSLLQRLEPGFFQTRQTGDILSRLTSDLSALEVAVGMGLAMGARMVFMLVLAVGALLFQNPRFGVVLLLATPLFVVAGRYLGPRAARASRDRQQNLARLTSTTQEDLAARPVIQAFGLESFMIDRYGRELGTLTRSAIHLSFVSGLTGFTAQSITTAIQVTALGLGAWLVVTQGNSPLGAWLNDDNPVTLGTLPSVLALMAQIVGATQGFNGIVQMFQQASGPMERVNELLRVTPQISSPPDAPTVPRLADAIRLEHVSFGYEATQPVLQDVSITIPAGSTVALVGPSGCGKSTLLCMLQRFYDPQRGSVTFDGKDVCHVDLASVRGQEGTVFQDSVLFDLSVRENIRMGKLDASDAEVEEAARQAEIHDVILTLPEGYDTRVGERGGHLSGGQRQRIALARAIIRNPAILLLDEATSALDPTTEAAVNATLARMAEGRTTVSVTHRLAGVIHADRIYVLERGRVLEHGTHEELLQAGGLYAQLWREQTEAMAPAAAPRGVDVARLSNVLMLASLMPEQLGDLARRLRAERFASGDVIVRQGDAAEKLYILDQGQVEVVVDDPAGGERRLAVLGPGDFFGEVALLHDVRRTATVRAQSPVLVDTLSKEDFLRQVGATPALREALEQTIAQRTAAVPQPRPAAPPGAARPVSADA